MVVLSSVQKSNSLIGSQLPAGLVGVFTGATSGIGESSLKQFVKEAKAPRCYLLGRSKTAANRIIAECKSLNETAEIIFISSDLALMKNIDRVCDQIKSREREINILFLSAGAAHFDKKTSSEGLRLLPALAVYGRFRFIQQLLPQLRNAKHLSRVINIGSPSKAGPLYPEDWQGFGLSIHALRGHIISMICLVHDIYASQAPEVSFVHLYPGAVNTNLLKRAPGMVGILANCVMTVLERWIAVPVDECGERCIFATTSARYPAQKGDKDGVPLVDGLDVCPGSDNKPGSGSYLIEWDGETVEEKVITLVENYTKEGMHEKVWEHVQQEFKRIEEIA